MQNTKPMKHRRHYPRHARGQSLVEVALSLSILLLVAFGLIDLGRAFFTTVAMNSIISEGANWGAAYPGCIPSATNTTDAAQVPPKCKGTNSVLCRMMNENTDLDPARVIDLSVKPINAQPGDVVTLSMTYRMPTITPLVQALFGRNLDLTTQVQEVVRGTAEPSNAGLTGSACSQGGIIAVTAVSNLSQNPAACSAGVATFQWQVVSATGYRIWRSAVSQPYPGGYVDINATTLTPGAMYTWTDPTAISSGGAAGSRNYTVASYNTDLSTGVTTYSTPLYFTGNCTAIQVTSLTATSCSINGVNLQWTPPTNPDTTIAGYAVIDATSHAIKYPFPGSGTSTGNYVFTNNPPEGTASVYMQPVDSSNSVIGLASNTWTLDCPPTNAELSFGTITLNPSPAVSNSNLTYTIPVVNAGPATAQSVQVTDTFDTTNSTAPYSFVSAAASQGTCTYAAPTVSCSIGNIANGATVTLTVVVKPTGTGTLLTNNHVTQTSPENSVIDNDKAANTTVGSSTGISITALQSSPSSVATGNSVTYIATVTNSGPGDAYNVAISESPLSGLTLQTTTNCPASSFVSGTFQCNLGTVTVGTTINVYATFLVPTTYTTPTTIVNTATLTTTSTNTSTQTTRNVSTTVSAGAIQNFRYASCTHPSGSTRTYTFTWNAYGWSGVDHYRITDQTTGETWSSSSGTSSLTSMTIPSSGTLHRHHSDDYYYVQAINASGNVVGSKSSPAVTTTCS